MLVRLLLAPLALLTVLLIGLAPSLARADDTGAKQLVKVPIAAAPSYAKYALVIGADDYLYAPQLTDCGQDAHAFADLLKTKFGFQTVILMTDDASDPRFRPTRVNIKKALNALYDAVTPGVSQIVFFYSGHGARTTDNTGDTDWLVPEDVDVSDPEGDFISYSAIRSKLDTLGPARALLITDACRNLYGGKAIGDGGKGFGPAGQAMGREVAELFSCEPTQISQEGDPKDFSESVFTHFLIQGLSGDPDAADPSGVVTFDSLERYVRGQVSGYVSQHFNTVQDPDGLTNSGEMVLAKLPNVAVTPAPMTPPAPVSPESVPPPVQNNMADARLLALWLTPDGGVDGAKAKSVTLNAVEGLLTAGASPDAASDAGETTLMVAAFAGNVELARLLLAHGADVNRRNEGNVTALFVAAQEGQTGVAQLLLEHGAAKTPADAYNALQVAAFKDHAEIVELLLTYGVDVKAKTDDGFTALMSAAENGHADMVRLLIHRGADIAAKTKDGHTALWWAKNPPSYLSVSAADKAATVAALKAAGATE